jgi:glycosyltransferase involved in cell wall biosynthesis
MATYNRAHFIEETLCSIQNQSFSNWECLIIDDGSKDKTVEVLKPYLDKDDRFQYIKRSSKYKKGLPGCRNMGLDLAEGDYIIFFDDDDIVHPQLLELCIKEFKERNIDYCRYERRVFFQ